MTDELVKLLRAQLQAKEDGLNVRDRRIEAQAAEIERLRDALEDVTSFGDRNAVYIACAALGGGDE